LLGLAAPLLLGLPFAACGLLASPLFLETLPLGVFALLLDACEQRLVYDHRLDRERLRLLPGPHEVGAQREHRDDRRVQRDGPADRTEMFTQRRHRRLPRGLTATRRPMDR